MEVMDGPNVELSIENLGWGAIMMQAMELMRQESVLCDVNLMTEAGDLLPAHSVVLAAGSSFFKQLLAKAKVNNSSVVVKCSIPRVALENVIGFLYTGRITPPLEELKHVRKAAKTFGIDTLVTLCDVFANQRSDTAPIGVIQRVTPEMISLAPESVLSALPIGESSLKHEIHQSLEEEASEEMPMMEEPEDNGPEEESGAPIPMRETRKGKRLYTSKMKRTYRYACDLCSRRFTSRQRLVSHKVTHKGEKAHRCITCGAAFIQMEYLREHISMHTNDRPHKCDVCGKLFRIMRHLKKHMKVHSDSRPYKCTDCKKTFKRSDRLKYHRRVHTGERPYSCDVCNKKFKLQETMKRHQVVHTNEKPHTCDVCDAVFRRPSSLQQHKYIHTGTLPFECKKCKRRFRQRIQLRCHQTKANDCVEAESADDTTTPSSKSETVEASDQDGVEPKDALMESSENEPREALAESSENEPREALTESSENEPRETPNLETTETQEKENPDITETENSESLKATETETLDSIKTDNVTPAESETVDQDDLQTESMEADEVQSEVDPATTE